MIKSAKTFETLKFQQIEQVATISFNRPEQMNCFNKQMGRELVCLTEMIMHDPSIKVVVLKGEGKLFMAGGDLQFFAEGLDQMPNGVREIIYDVNAVIHNLTSMAKPVIAVVHGSVAGVGLGLMLACDLIISAENTKFTVAYPKIGITPDGGTSYFLVKNVGVRKAMELALLSDVIGAKEAKEMGLLNWVVPENELQGHMDKLSKRLSQSATLALARTKKLIHHAASHSLAEQLVLEAKFFSETTTSHDFKEGVTAFLQKRAPEFSGE